MRHRILSVAIVCALALSINEANAGKKHSGYQPPPANQPIAPGALPSSVLQPFLDARLNIILAPMGQPGLKHPEAVDDLRASINDGMSKAVPGKQPAFQAAIVVCNILSQAVNERQKAVANLEGSQVGAQRTGLAKHPKNDVSSTNAFFANVSKTQWDQRSAQLRQEAEQAYARERAIEAQVKG